MEKGKQRVYLLCTVLLMAGFYLAYRLYTIQVAANRDWALKAVNQRAMVWPSTGSGARSWTAMGSRLPAGTIASISPSFPRC